MEILTFPGLKNTYGPEVDLFTLPPTSIAVVDPDYQKIFPMNVVKGNTKPIRFRILGSDAFLDLKDSFVYIKAKILKKDGSQLLATDQIAPGNLFLHTLFRNVSVKFNDKTVSSSNFMYPYKAWLRNQFKISTGTKDCELSKEVYYKDTDPDDCTTSNPGFTQRLALAAGSKQFEMIGKISDDIFEQNRYILNTVTVDITFSRSNPNFCLSGYVTETSQQMESTNVKSRDNEFRIEICDMNFYVKRRTLEAELFNSIQRKFSMGKKTKYPISKIMMRAEHISQGCVTYMNASLFSGKLPNFMCVGIISSDAFDGKLNKSPFNFKSNNMNKLVIIVNGQPVLYNTLECNFKNGKHLLAYNTLFGGKETRYGNGISMVEYIKRNTLSIYEFASSKPRQHDGEKTGTIGVEIYFSDPLQEHHRLIIMTSCQQVIEIDKNGRVEVLK
jgi:hypothetical protein